MIDFWVHFACVRSQFQHHNPSSFCLKLKMNDDFFVIHFFDESEVFSHMHLMKFNSIRHHVFSKKRPRRIHIINQKWKIVSKRLKISLKQYVLRYGKMLKKQINTVILNAIKHDVDKNNAYFKKTLMKIFTNTNMWKNQSLNLMKIKTNVNCKNKRFWIDVLQNYVKIILQKNTKKFFTNNTNTIMFFNFFDYQYFQNDVETVFFWTAKYLTFNNEKKRTKESF